jgi:hypothetical protein
MALRADFKYPANTYLNRSAQNHAAEEHFFLAICRDLLPALAKCPFAKYRVEGRLQLPKSAHAENLRIYFFFNNTNRTTEYPVPAPQATDFAVPAEDGVFWVEAWLSTVGDHPHRSRERCDRIETAGELVIVGPGVYAHRAEVRFEQTKSTIRRLLSASATVSSIVLEAKSP